MCISIQYKDLSKHFSVQETQEKFTKVKTCLFLPNSVFIFPRTTNSFHGVEEVNIEQKERNLLLLNYYDKIIYIYSLISLAFINSLSKNILAIYAIFKFKRLQGNVEKSSPNE